VPLQPRHCSSLRSVPATVAALYPGWFEPLRRTPADTPSPLSGRSCMHTSNVAAVDIYRYVDRRQAWRQTPFMIPVARTPSLVLSWHCRLPRDVRSATCRAMRAHQRTPHRLAAPLYRLPRTRNNATRIRLTRVTAHARLWPTPYTRNLPLPQYLLRMTGRASPRSLWKACRCFVNTTPSIC